MIKVSASPPRLTIRTHPLSGSLAPKTVRRVRNAGLSHHLLSQRRPGAPRELHAASVNISLHLPNEGVTRGYLCTFQVPLTFAALCSLAGVQATVYHCAFLPLFRSLFPLSLPLPRSFPSILPDVYSGLPCRRLLYVCEASGI